MARCEVCGRHYDELRFQVVLRRTAQTFDRVECAVRALRARTTGESAPEVVSGDVSHVLEQLERTAAQLFMTRAQLESERRQRAELEERAFHLATERDGLAERLESYGTGWRRLLGFRRCPAI